MQSIAGQSFLHQPQSLLGPELLQSLPPCTLMVIWELIPQEFQANLLPYFQIHFFLVTFSPVTLTKQILCWESPSWIITLSWWRSFRNSMKLWAMPRRVTKDGQVTVKSSDEMWSTGGGNGKPFQFSCHENPMNSMERQKDTTPEHERPPPLRSEVSNMLLGNSNGQLLIAPERMRSLGQSRNDAQLWICVVVKVKSNAVGKILHRNLEY